MLEGVPTPTMTRTPTLQVETTGATPKLMPSVLDHRQPMRAVSTPVKLLEEGVRVVDLSLVDAVERDSVVRNRMVRERSNGQVPTAARPASGYGLVVAGDQGGGMHAGDVLVAEDVAAGGDGLSAWKVESVLGEGAFSTVWSGKEVLRRLKGKAKEVNDEWDDVDCTKSVAIKVMDKRICRENDRTRISFVREVEVLKVRVSVPRGSHHLLIVC
jgi:hypothetical protein